LRVEKMGRIIFGHPFSKAVGLGLFGILGNVFAGSYVFEITKSDHNGVQFLDWRATPHSYSFWALFVVLLLAGAYGIGMARFESRVRRALTNAAVRQRAT
jgi:hypothetical protein